MLIEFSEELKIPSAKGSPVFDEAYLAQLRNRDEETAKHFDKYFRRLVRTKLWGKFGPQIEEDLVDAVMLAVFAKIMAGEPRDAACLPAYVRGICANFEKKTIRDLKRGEIVDLNLDQLSNGAKTAEERVLKQEKSQAVRKVLAKLRTRDREILMDVFYYELDRDEVCNKHGLTREQLRMILFHARQRFQDEWEKEE
jgi:RNA polymerase sigma factor (sigma-70 family)